MTNVKDLTIDELEYLIEQKILEVLGDPDSGLDLKEEFKQELKRRLENPSRTIPHDEVVSRIGYD
jgi:putative addiction module component (TIGR02574 family)